MPSGLAAWLRLARTDRIGPVTFAQLIRRFGTAEAALDAAPRLAARGGGKSFVLPNESLIAREIDTVARLGGRILMACEADFPPGLAALDAPPPVMTVLGHVPMLKRDTIAMVGARNAAALGRSLAAQLARGLGEAGLVVASGLARGIDAAAHDAALGTGTVAVVAGGVDVIYPPENEALYARIKAEGAVISEMPPGEMPQARHFPRRNRLISGLSRGVMVVEAAERSGSLITAAYALEQGREVFAAPGSPLDPRARGVNRLIRDGATLVQEAEDILSVLNPMLGGGFRDPGQDGVSVPPAQVEAEADRVRAAVEERLGPAPVSIDELIRQVGAPAGVVLTVILELELAGRCARHPGNAVSWAG
jgi:DNA processing protein